MKKFLNFSTLLLVAKLQFWSAYAQDLSENAISPETVGILPAAKQGSIISDDESSPFGLPAQKRKGAANRQQYSQKDSIREILGNLKVTGIVDNGKRILLGDMIVEKGKLLEDVLVGQNEKVICNEITETYLDVEFISQKRAGKKDELRIPIDLRTRVGIKLKGGQDGMAFAPLKGEELPIAFEAEE